MSVRLFVLGVVYGKKTYGYEIKATAQLWGLERWAQIREGSIYHALTTLEKEGLLCAYPVEEGEKNRPRYVYGITAEGRKEFLGLLRETLRVSPYEGRAIDLGLAFAHYLPQEECVALLTERQGHLEEAREQLLAGFARLGEYENLAAWVPAGMEHSLGRLDFEIAWNRKRIVERGGG